MHSLWRQPSDDIFSFGEAEWLRLECRRDFWLEVDEAVSQRKLLGCSFQEADCTPSNSRSIVPEQCRQDIEVLQLTSLVFSNRLACERASGGLRCSIRHSRKDYDSCDIPSSFPGQFQPLGLLHCSPSCSCALFFSRVRVRGDTGSGSRRGSLTF